MHLIKSALVKVRDKYAGFKVFNSALQQKAIIHLRQGKKTRVKTWLKAQS